MKSKREVEVIVSAMGVFQSLIFDLVELVKKFGGSMEDIYRLITPEGKETLEEIAHIITKGANNVRNRILKLISGNESLVLDACDGTEILADAKDVFALIDSAFRNWGADEKGSATEETVVDVYEMVKNATFSQMFGELNADVSNLCLTQHQIRNFVKKYREWLRTGGYSTFFLFKSKNNFFIADAHFRSDNSLLVDVYRRFESGGAWNAECRHRVVVPKLV